MPSRNSKGNSKADDAYQASLDQLEEILNIYSATHAVILLGDFNASFQQRTGNEQDIWLSSFVLRNSLVYAQNGKNTFTHPNKTDQAEIDYIFYNKIGADIIKLVSVESYVALKTSDHVPVYAISKVEVRQKTPGYLMMRCTPKWDKCDRHSYKTFISKHL